MKKSKVLALVLAGALAVGVVGGTLAWFTSQDSVKNIFQTGTILEPDNNDGVDIYEEFVPPTNVLPGTETTKAVQVKNTSSFDTFIRVKLTPKFVSAMDGVNVDDLDVNMIELNFENNLGQEDGKWLDGGDGYYYFMGRVGAGTFTNKLLESVTLATAADNNYRGVEFEVLVEAESIQADNDAHVDAWTTSPAATARLNTLAGQAPTNIAQEPGTSATN